MLHGFLTSAIKAAKRLLRAKNSKVAAQVLLTVAHENAGNTGCFTCPPTLESLMELLPNIRVESFQLQLIRASVPLLESHVAKASIEEVEAASRPVPKRSRLRVDGNDCSFIFDHVDGRMSLEGESGVRLLRKLEANRELLRVDNENQQ